MSRPSDAPSPYRIAMVCTGNICRSPTAEVVLTAKLLGAGLDDRVVVESCGLGDWHVGHPMDSRSAQELVAAGYDPTRHRARLLPIHWSPSADEPDLLLAMDSTHHADLLRGGATPARVKMFRDFDPVDSGGDVPDPYYGGAQGFEEVLTMVERTCEVLVSELVTTFGDPATTTDLGRRHDR